MNHNIFDDNLRYRVKREIDEYMDRHDVCQNGREFFRSLSIEIGTDFYVSSQYKELITDKLCLEVKLDFWNYGQLVFLTAKSDNFLKIKNIEIFEKVKIYYPGSKEIADNKNIVLDFDHGGPRFNTKPVVDWIEATALKSGLTYKELLHESCRED